jgi:hypothetical protein
MLSFSYALQHILAAKWRPRFAARALKESRSCRCSLIISNALSIDLTGTRR